MPYLLPGCAAILLSSDISIIVQLETNTGNENVGQAMWHKARPNTQSLTIMQYRQMGMLNVSITISDSAKFTINTYVACKQISKILRLLPVFDSGFGHCPPRGTTGIELQALTVNAQGWEIDDSVHLPSMEMKFCFVFACLWKWRLSID